MDAAGVAPSRSTRLEQARCWAPVFGGVDVRELPAFDLVVVDAVQDRTGAREISAADVTFLKERGTLVLAYLSVGTAENWRHYAPEVERTWTLGPVSGWPGEQWVDARHHGWRALLAAEARTLAGLGFDGLYLDNLDVAELFPETADGVVDTVELLDEAVGDRLLIGQNGLAVADRLPIDGIAHEDVFWRWDDGYRATERAESRELVSGLQKLRAKGLPVFTVDYTEPGASAAGEVVRRSLAEGFRPAVTVLQLDRAPHASAPCHD